MRLLLPVSRDPVSPLSAVSTIARIYEEYGIDGVVALPSSGASVEGYLKRIAERLGLSFEARKPLPTDPEGLEAQGSRGLLDAVRGVVEGCGRCVVAVSPAGRYYAAVLAAAGIWAKGNAEVVHVHFYFGPWSGLPYPYTPRRLQPVVVLNEVWGPAAEPRDAAHEGVWKLGASKRPGPGPAGFYACKSDAINGLPGVDGAPLLRCVVAEAARRLNAVKGARVLAGSGGFKAVCGRLRVTVAGKDIQGGERVADLCDARGVALLLDWLDAVVKSLDEVLAPGGGLGPLASLRPLAGLSPLKLGGDPLLVLQREGGAPPLLVDTNLVYYGVHAYAWAGLRVAVPECVVVELERRLSETIKNLAPGRGDPRRRARAFTDLAAYLAYRDLLAAPAASLVPSPPLDCDVAIPRIDAPILDRYTPATADSGAVNYWRVTGRLRRDPVQASFGDVEWTSIASESPQSVWMPYAYYALAQSLALLAALAEALSPEGGCKKQSKSGGSGEKRGAPFSIEAYIEGPGGATDTINLPAGMVCKPVAT